MYLIEIWFQKDQGVLLFTFGVINSPVFHITAIPLIQTLFIEHLLRARHCVGSKELGPCPHGMYSKHVQRYIHGDECSLVQLELNQYWKRPIREIKYKAQVI